MLKRYFHREADSSQRNTDKLDENAQVNQAASVACVIEDEVAEGMTVSDEEVLLLYNLKKKETVDDVVVNPDLTTEQ